MRHRSHNKYFSRKFNARKALFRGLVDSLVEHERIKTTITKAKEIRRHVEKAITLGRDSSLNTRRILLSRYPNETTVEKILSNISPRFKDRAGGYTRIIKLDRRPGDTAEMAFLEFVDFDFNKKAAEKAKKQTGKTDETAKKAEKKAKAKQERAVMRAGARLRKSRRKIQSASRVFNRD